MPQQDPLKPTQTRQLLALAQPAQQPTQPVQAQRQVAATSTAPVQAQPVLSNVQGNETVQGQLEGLLKSGSPLLEQSRNRAIVQAASRGLQNSTMAAQAGEAAFIDAAAPIAAADASTYSNRALVNVDAQNRFGLQEQGGNISSRLQGEQGDISSRLQGEQGDIASRLQGEQGSINSRLQQEQGEIRLGELKLQGEIEGKLADQGFQHQQTLMLKDFEQRMSLTKFDAAQQVERMNLQHQQTLQQIEANANAQTKTDSATFSRQIGGAYLTAISNRQGSASQEIAQIYQTQGLTSAQQQTAVGNAYARMQTDITALGAYFSSAPAWDNDWSTSGTPFDPNARPIGTQQPTSRSPEEAARGLLDGFMRGRR